MYPCRIDDNESLDLGRSISTLSRYGKWYMELKTGPFDFGSGQHGFVFYLFGHNGANQDEISKALELDKATTARAIQKLEETGYVTRKNGEKDKRINHVFLTEKAYAIQKDIRGFSSEWTDTLTHTFSADEKEQLKHLVAKLTTNALEYKNNAQKKVGHHEK